MEVKELRYRLTVPISITYVAGQSRGEGRLEDLSRSGFFVKSPMLPPNGAAITAMISTPSGQLLSVEGVVRWNTAGSDASRRSGFGVQVSSFGPEYGGFVEGVLAAGQTI